jgi:biopolymer transport protein TolQ
MANSVTSSAELAGTVPVTDMSILSLIGHADLVVKLVMLLLIAASFWSWSIIADKYIRFKAIQSKTDRFEKIFWSGQVLDQLYERLKSRADHPMAIIFVAAMHEWARQGANKFIPSDSGLRAGIKERLGLAMEVACNREMDKLQRHLGFWPRSVRLLLSLVYLVRYGAS